MQRVKGFVGVLLDRHVEVLLFVSLAVLCTTGVGVPFVSCVVCLGLCAVGLTGRQAGGDARIVVSLLLFNLCGLASSYAAYGNFISGYVSIQMVIPVVYVLAASLPADAKGRLRSMCVSLFGVVAFSGIVEVLCGPREGMHRLSGLLNNPNATGIFLVMGWLLIVGTDFDGTRLGRVLRATEPVVLSALAMTLSMGSFLSMAVGMLVFLAGKYRGGDPFQSVFRTACVMLSRASVGMSAGLLAYISVSRTRVRWLGWLVLAYVMVLAVCWDECLDFLESVHRAATACGMAGAVVAIVAVALRPSAIATFAERIGMMENGLHYIFVNPLVGVGPLKWRMLNMADPDQYFNTWHIHNVLVHVAVEFGLLALACLIIFGVRSYRSCRSVHMRAMFAAFAFHNMIDTSFFIIGSMCVMMALLGTDVDAGDECGQPGAKTWPNRALVVAGVFSGYVLLCLPMA